MIATFGAGAQHYATPQELVVDLVAAMAPNVTVLVKGSRFMAMERVVNEIISKQNNATQKNGEAH